uniref:F-box domain-containing protein n=2 Tax=Ditylenchus dipsaci TaxID=166011 RepID=A0A915CYN9_9BILA
MVPVDILFEILEYLNRKDCSVLMGASNKQLSHIVSHYWCKLKKKMPVSWFPCKTLGWANAEDGKLVYAQINTHQGVIAVTENLLLPTRTVLINISVIGSCVKVSYARTKVCLGYLYCERKVGTRSTKKVSTRGEYRLTQLSVVLPRKWLSRSKHCSRHSELTTIDSFCRCATSLNLLFFKILIDAPVGASVHTSPFPFSLPHNSLTSSSLHYHLPYSLPLIIARMVVVTAGMALNTCKRYLNLE